MNRRFISAAVLAVLCLGFVGVVGASAPALPDNVASHFDVAGRADGWMQRSNYLLLMGIMGLGMPLFIVGICYLTRFLPDWMINLPNKDYWLAPGRREHTNDYLFGHSLWLAALMLVHFTALHILTVVANGRTPPSLPPSGLMSTMAGFMVLLVWWIIVLVRHFRRPA